MRQNCRTASFVLCVLCLCMCQRQASAQTSAAALLAQLSQAVSGGKVINSVTLQGNAVWHAGSLEDSGPITLTASSSGTAQMQLSLSTLGSRVESQMGLGPVQTCLWTGANGTSHAMTRRNCWKPLILFFPAISLQVGLMPSGLGLSDLGTGEVGSGTYRHLQGQFVFGVIPSNQVTDVMTSSTTDVGLDVTTFLPAVLDYTVQPDTGMQTPITMEMRYSNYTPVSGVQIPFSIQRYVNGSLQLDITVSSAQTN